MKKTYIIKGLDCPNCALEVERALQGLDGVKHASLSFAAEKLVIEYEGDKSEQQLLALLQETAAKTEGGVRLLDPEKAQITDLKRSIATPQNLLRVIGVAVFILAVILEETEVLTDYYSLFLFVPAYVLTGYEVVFRCFRNLFKGKLFDENFLMTLATAGAFFLGEYLEAVSVMIFYQLGEFFNSIAAERSRNSVRALICAKGADEADSAASEIEAVESAASRKSKPEQFITKFSRVYTPVVMAIALFVGLVMPLIMQTGFSEWINRGLMIILVACPCALVLSIPMSYFSGLGAASRCNVLVKGGNYLDAMSGLKSVVLSSATAPDPESIAQLKALGIESVYKIDEADGISSEQAQARLGDKKTAFIAASAEDAALLGAADVAIAMADGGLIVAADVVITNNELNRVVAAVKVARRVRLLVLINIVFIMATKLLVMALSISGALTSLLLAEVADVGVAVIATLIAMTILRYNPLKGLCHADRSEQQ